MAPLTLKVLLRLLPPDVTSESIGRALDALAPTAKGSIVYVDRGKRRRDGTVLPTRVCVELRITPPSDSTTSDAALQAHALAALSRQYVVDSQGERLQKDTSTVSLRCVMHAARYTIDAHSTT